VMYNGGHLVEPDVRLTEIDRTVHLDAMKMGQLCQRLCSFHPVSAVSDHDLQASIQMRE